MKYRVNLPAAAAVVIMLLCASVFAEEKTLTENEKNSFMLELSKTLGEIKSFDVEFFQTRKLEIFMDEINASGKMYYKAPDKLRWEIDDPFLSIIIFNAGQTGKFDKQDGELRKLNPGSEDMIKHFLTQMLGWLNGSFVKSEEFNYVVKKDAEWKVIMTPKSGEVMKFIKQIELHMKPETYRMSKIIILENEKDSITIDFKNEIKDPELKDSLFDTKNPEYKKNDDKKK